jgi:hypothetical protein
MQTPFWTAKNNTGSLAIGLIVSVSPTAHPSKCPSRSPETPPSGSSHRSRGTRFRGQLWGRQFGHAHTRPPSGLRFAIDAASESSAVGRLPRLRRPDRAMHFLRCVPSDKRRPRAPAGSTSPLRKGFCYPFSVTKILKGLRSW